MDVKATLLSRGRGAVDANDRNSWQRCVVKAVWGVERVINLSQLDLQCWLVVVHLKTRTDEADAIWRRKCDPNLLNRSTVHVVFTPLQEPAALSTFPQHPVA